MSKIELTPIAYRWADPQGGWIYSRVKPACESLPVYSEIQVAELLDRLEVAASAPPPEAERKAEARIAVLEQACGAAAVSMYLDMSAEQIVASAPGSPFRLVCAAVGLDPINEPRKILEIAGRIRSQGPLSPPAEISEVVAGPERKGGWYPTHVHLKRGSEYEVIGTGWVQSETPLHDMDTVIVYRGIKGDLWARREDEFNDGRFASISPD